MNQHNSLLPKHGGYKHLLSYQLAELIFDITVLFCEKYVPVSDRTNDQMVQSARSGFQNIAEGSVNSGVSKKSEIKLTGIAIGCLDELIKDYRKYLQKKDLEEWPFQYPVLVDLKQRQVKTLETFREWVKNTWEVSGKQVPPDQIAANGVLSLLNLTLYLIRKQLAALEKKFLEDGGIAERMQRLRKEARARNNTDTRTGTDKHGQVRTGRKYLSVCRVSPCGPCLSVSVRVSFYGLVRTVAAAFADRGAVVFSGTGAVVSQPPPSAL